MCVWGGVLCSTPPRLWIQTHLAGGLLVSRTLGHEVHGVHTAADFGGGGAQALAEGSCGRRGNPRSYQEPPPAAGARVGLPGPLSSPVQVPCRCLCPSNTSSLRGFFSISSSARSSIPTDDARLGGEAARGASGGAPEPRRRGSKSNKTWGRGRGGAGISSKPRSPPRSRPPGAYVAQSRGRGVSGGRP